MDIFHEKEKIGYVIILKNITAFKEQDLAKTHFIATISHELKTPLAATDFSLQLLDDERTGPLIPGQKELLDSIRNDNRRMIRMVSELLDFSKVESGNILITDTTRRRPSRSFNMRWMPWANRRKAGR